MDAITGDTRMSRRTALLFVCTQFFFVCYFIACVGEFLALKTNIIDEKGTRKPNLNNLQKNNIL